MNLASLNVFCDECVAIPIRSPSINTYFNWLGSFSCMPLIYLLYHIGKNSFRGTLSISFSGVRDNHGGRSRII